MSVIAPVCALSIPSIHPPVDKYQEFQDEFPGTNYGEKYLAKFMAKIPDDITLVLYNAEFLEEMPGNSNRGSYSVEFMSRQYWVDSWRLTYETMS